MKAFEITLSGFSGETDATDSLIVWVSAGSRAVVYKALNGCKALVGSVTEIDVSPDDPSINLVVTPESDELDQLIKRTHQEFMDGEDIYINRYKHCDIDWNCEGDSMHNDRCPKCDKEITPFESYDVKNMKDIVH